MLARSPSDYCFFPDTVQTSKARVTADRAIAVRILALFVWALASIATPRIDAQNLQTVAESSGFRATARHQQVVELCEKLAASYENIELSSIGSSVEGRDLPLLLISDPPVANVEAARASKKPVVLVFGNIHAGEVCGKEALLKLARDIVLDEVVETLILAFVPVLNADGNELMSKDNRPGQVGPEQGMGVRHNAQRLDLNRDWVKLESPEARAIVAFMNSWDPIAVIDTHTTNGSFHRYGVTWAGPKHPSTHASIVSLVRDEMMPEVNAALVEQHDQPTFVYGNFADGHTAWKTYPDHPRYGTPYRGLRHRVAILSEAYSYSSYEKRILDTERFVKACIDWLATNHKKVRETIAKADESVGPGSTLTLRSQIVAAPDKARVLGFVEKEVGGKLRPTPDAHDYKVDVYDRFAAELDTRLPWAYAIPDAWPAVIDNLRAHGIRMLRLQEDIVVDAEAQEIDAIERADRVFQGHRLLRLEATPIASKRVLKAGTVLVPCKQPLGILAGYLLEPEATDSLASWNFFDRQVHVGSLFPVIRVMNETVANTRVLRAPLAAKKPLTFAGVYESRQGLPFGGGFPADFSWIDDTSYREARDGKHWKVDAETGARTSYYDAEALAAALESIDGIDIDRAQSLVRLRAFTFAPNDSGVLVQLGLDLYYASLVKTGQEPAEPHAIRLTNTRDVEEEMPTFSPDGTQIAFVRSNDLWVVDVQTGVERQLTTGGTDTLRNGKASWVYFEEVFGRNWKTFWWSPDSLHLAYYQIDSASVKEFTLTDNRRVGQIVEVSTYPKPGEPNPTAKIGVVSISGGETQWVDLSEYEPQDMLLTGTGWLPDSSAVYFYVQNRLQTWLDVRVSPILDSASRKLVRQTTKAWVDQPHDPYFLADGRFILSSEKNGWKHLYLHRADGSSPKALTTGEWEVRKVHLVDEAGGWIYVSGTKDSHLGGDLYRVGIASGRIERLTFAPGTHRSSLSPSGRLFVDSWSSHRRPDRTELFRGDGSPVRVIDAGVERDLADYVVCPQKFLEIDGTKGRKLPASLMLPPNFDASKKWPVWFSTYAGPHAPSVRDTWSGGRVWDQIVCQSGIVVFRFDPYTATGRGAVSAWECYEQLGVPELADILAGIDWLREQSWVDRDRVGMSGHSYGGFITSYAMTHCDYFCAGIAGAPVTDWRDYDTIYTERYMRTPKLNPKGYQRTSVLESAGNLQGRLLLLHGTVDDNVHPQNSLRFIHAMQRAGKLFETMFYPGLRHRLSGLHYNRLRWDFIQRTVGQSRTGS